MRREPESAPRKKPPDIPLTSPATIAQLTLLSRRLLAVRLPGPNVLEDQSGARPVSDLPLRVV